MVSNYFLSLAISSCALSNCSFSLSFSYTTLEIFLVDDAVTFSLSSSRRSLSSSSSSTYSSSIFSISSHFFSLFYIKNSFLSSLSFISAIISSYNYYCSLSLSCASKFNYYKRSTFALASSYSLRVDYKRLLKRAASSLNFLAIVFSTWPKLLHCRRSHIILLFISRDIYRSCTYVCKLFLSDSRNCYLFFFKDSTCYAKLSD